MAKNQYSIGLLLIGVAVVLLLGKLGVFSFLGSLVWPLFILVPGIALHMLYFGRVLPSGVLVPGGILVTYSLMFFYCNLFGWSSMKYLWPGFVFGVAVGLYELHLFDRNTSRGVAVAAMIIALVSVVLFSIMFLMTAGIYIVAAVLIIAGVALVAARRPRSW
ncbi:hypothetical protein [Paenibacillus sp. MBLB4367]|uniref:hypothetical protein n=1 Tax=Paenibacillus sp. MBLB4367 TaxID=3384767 RepID=UPI0039081344